MLGASKIWTPKGDFRSVDQREMKRASVNVPTQEHNQQLIAKFDPQGAAWCNPDVLEPHSGFQ